MGKPQVQYFPLTGWEQYTPTYLPKKDKVCPEMSYNNDYDDPRGDAFHHALDLFASPGTPIISVADGYAWPNRDLGDTAKEFVFFEDGGYHAYVFGDDGIIYYYAHMLTKPLIRPGSRVRAGNMVGQVGASGNVSDNTCDHLHMAMYKTSSEGNKLGPVNPFDYVRNAPVLALEESYKATVSRLSSGGRKLITFNRPDISAGPIYGTSPKTHTWAWVLGILAVGGAAGWAMWKLGPRP